MDQKLWTVKVNKPTHRLYLWPTGGSPKSLKTKQKIHHWQADYRGRGPNFWAVQRPLGSMFGVPWYEMSYVGLVIFARPKD